MIWNCQNIKDFNDALNIFMSNGHIWDSTKERFQKTSTCTVQIDSAVWNWNLLKDKTDDFAESLAKFFNYDGGETQILWVMLVVEHWNKKNILSQKFFRVKVQSYK